MIAGAWASLYRWYGRPARVPATPLNTLHGSLPYPIQCLTLALEEDVEESRIMRTELQRRH